MVPLLVVNLARLSQVLALLAASEEAVSLSGKVLLFTAGKRPMYLYLNR